MEAEMRTRMKTEMSRVTKSRSDLGGFMPTPMQHTRLYMDTLLYRALVPDTRHFVDLGQPYRLHMVGCMASAYVSGRAEWPATDQVTVTGPPGTSTADLQAQITTTFIHPNSQDTKQDACSRGRNRRYPSRALYRQHPPFLRNQGCVFHRLHKQVLRPRNDRRYVLETKVGGRLQFHGIGDG